MSARSNARELRKHKLCDPVGTDIRPPRLQEGAARAVIRIQEANYGWDHLSGWFDRRCYVHPFTFGPALIKSEAVMTLSSIAPQDAAVEPVVTDLPVGGFMSWGPIVGGALVAATSFLIATAFATAIGLAVSSASPTWRDTSVGLAVLSGAWIVLTAIGSFALGGYIAGRSRRTWRSTADDIHFRDGVHGLVVWGLGGFLGVVLAFASAAALPRSETVTGPASAEPSFLTYEIDRLFRSDAKPGSVDQEARAEGGRILQRGVGRKDLTAEDRDYLTRLVVSRTGLPPAEAVQRVSQVVADAKTAASQARKSAIIIGFTLAAALVAAAGAAWACSIIGGRHRDNAITPSLYFRRR